MADADASLDIAVRVKNANEVKQTLGGIQRETIKSQRATVKAAREEAIELKRIRHKAKRDRAHEAAESRRMETREAQAASAARIAAMQAEAKALDASYAKKIASIRNMVRKSTKLERSADDLVTRNRLANIKRFELARTKSEDYITRRVQNAIRQRAMSRGGVSPSRSTQATLPSASADQRRAFRAAMVGGVLGAGLSIARTGMRESVNPDPGDADFFESIGRLRAVGGAGRAGALSEEAVQVSQSGETSVLASDMAATAAAAVSEHGINVFNMLEGRLAQLATVADATNRPFNEVVDNFIRVGKAVDATDEDLDGLIKTIGDRAAGGGGGNLFRVLTGVSGTDKPLINLKRMMSGQGSEEFGSDAAAIAGALLGGGASPAGAQTYIEKLEKSIKKNRKKLDMGGGLVGVVEQLADMGQLPKDPRTERFRKSITQGELRGGPAVSADEILTQMLRSEHFVAKTNKARRQAGTFAVDDPVSRAFGPPAERSQGFYNLFSPLGDVADEMPILKDLAGAGGSVLMTMLGVGLGPWLLKKIGLGGVLSTVASAPSKVAQVLAAVTGTSGVGGVGSYGLGTTAIGALGTSLLSLVPTHGRTMQGPGAPEGVANLDYTGPYSVEAMREARLKQRLFVEDRASDNTAMEYQMITAIGKLERAVRENTTIVRENNDGVPFYLRRGG